MTLSISPASQSSTAPPTGWVQPTHERAALALKAINESRWSAADKETVETAVKEELRDGDGILGLRAEELSALVQEAIGNARAQGACFLRLAAEAGGEQDKPIA